MKKIIIFLCLIIIILITFNYQIEDTYQVNSSLDYNYSEYQNIINSSDSIVGYLIINDVFETKIVQTDNNEYYLNHNLDGKILSTGETFLDYRVNINTSPKLLIYGHMSSIHNTPFTNLKKYLNKDYFNNHLDLILITNNNYLNYRIFGITIYENNYLYLNINFKNNDEYQNNLNNFIKRSLYYTNDNPNHKNTLFLQTCYPHKDNTYIVLGAYLEE